MLNILIIGMMDIKGGIEQLIYQIFSRLDKNKIQCDFLCYCPRCAYEENLKAAGSAVYHIARRGQHPLKCRKELKAFFKEHRTDYDYIWINTCSASNGMGHVYAKRYTNAKIITHSHNTYFDSAGGVVRVAHMLLHKANRKKLFRYTDFCFACSAEAGEWLFGPKAESVVIIKNGIETDAFRFDPSAAERIKKEFSLGGCKVIGHAGRFCEAKNQSFLLEIFAEVIKKSDHYRLFLAGEGDLLIPMQQKAADLGIADKVIFAGYREDMEAVLQAFDLLLLPSLFEGLGIIAVEAQASGLPCLLADTIPKEVYLTDLAFEMRLTDPAEQWADQVRALVEAHENIDRTAYCKIVAQNGYDINDTVRELEAFLTEHKTQDLGGNQ